VFTCEIALKLDAFTLNEIARVTGLSLAASSRIRARARIQEESSSASRGVDGEGSPISFFAGLSDTRREKSRITAHDEYVERLGCRCNLD
jgi:hypothetical protein